MGTKSLVSYTQLFRMMHFGCQMNHMLLTSHRLSNNNFFPENWSDSFALSELMWRVVNLFCDIWNETFPDYLSITVHAWLRLKLFSKYSSTEIVLKMESWRTKFIHMNHPIWVPFFLPFSYNFKPCHQWNFLQEVWLLFYGYPINSMGYASWTQLLMHDWQFKCFVKKKKN